jgi:hypothetical protein
MEVMKATTARAKTIEAIEAKRRRMIDMIDARITASVAAGKFECNFLVDSPAIQDGLFDYLTSLGYAVKFMPHVRNGEKYYDSDSRIINVSWEEAVQ